MAAIIQAQLLQSAPSVFCATAVRQINLRRVPGGAGCSMLPGRERLKKHGKHVSAVKTLFVEVLLIFSVMKHQLVTARRRVRKSLEADLD